MWVAWMVGMVVSVCSNWLVAECEMMRSAKGSKKEGKGEMSLVWEEMKMDVGQVSE